MNFVTNDTFRCRGNQIRSNTLIFGDMYSTTFILGEKRLDFTIGIHSIRRMMELILSIVFKLALAEIDEGMKDVAKDLLKACENFKKDENSTTKEIIGNMLNAFKALMLYISLTDVKMESSAELEFFAEIYAVYYSLIKYFYN